ncbi:MAG: molybdopterin-dependent oxidoreductase [Nitrospirae bacterium]|nr:molybdopterin-dependent oxidoreductase [Nitrospirota bacterium]
MANDSKNNWLNGVTRRSFLKVSGALSAAVMARPIFALAQDAATPVYGEVPPDALTGTIRYRFSVCQNCHARCGLMCKVVDGVLVKIDGNPFHPNNREEDERFAYATDVSAWSGTDYEKNRGRLCPKGQAGVQVVYDPYRIKHPLKRAGGRGENKWTVISWDQALTEIADKLKSLVDVTNRVSTPIYSSDTALKVGPIANGLAFSPGRSTDGDFTSRIFKSSWGTANDRLDHTSICEASRHVGTDLITGARKKAKSAKGNNFFRADIMGAEYFIMWGANFLEANFPMLALSRKVVEMKKKGGKLVVVDPRFSNSAAKADRWLPVKPGTDAALALGMARWIIDNAKYDANFLKAPSSAAAAAVNEKSWSDATYLVNTSTKALLTSKDAGLATTTLSADVTSSATTIAAADTSAFPSKGFIKIGSEVIYYKSTDATNFKECTRGIVGAAAAGTSGAEVVAPFVVYRNSAASIDVSSAADLEVDTTVNGVAAKSVFTLMKARVQEKSIDEYAAICGIDSSTISAVAQEFTSHGKKAVVDTYRGVVKHTNGIYAHFACMLLNTLIGNYDWKGGSSKGGGGWKINGVSGQVDISKVPSGVSAKGPRIDRSGNDYEDVKSVLQAAGKDSGGYPAKRPWFPFGFYGNYQEIIPGMADGYPYPLKALFLYWNAIPYSVPGAKALYEATMRDESKIPLVVGITTVIGEAYEYADYLLPECGYLERWSFPGVPAALTKSTSLRQPVIGSFDDRSWDAEFDPNQPNAYKPAAVPDARQLEDILIALATKLGLPGVGSNAMVKSDGTAVRNLDRTWDFIKSELENLSADSGKSIKEIVSKGGVFADPGADYDGSYLHGQYAGLVRIYIEDLATIKDSMNGNGWDPLPRYVPISRADDVAVDDSAGYPYQLITFKSVLHGQARTIQCPWLVQIGLHGSQFLFNFVEMNASDAAKLGVVTGDTVKVTSASSTAGVTGKVWVTQGMRPGVVGISHHYGHWAEGSKPRTEDGAEWKTEDGKPGYDPSRGLGIAPNTIMRLDESHGNRGASNSSLQDKIGTSVAFNDTWVKVEIA